MFDFSDEIVHKSCRDPSVAEDYLFPAIASIFSPPTAPRTFEVHLCSLFLLACELLSAIKEHGSKRINGLIP